MTKAEFAKIAAYLSAGIGKKMPSETMDVWFDILQDLPAELALMAVKKALSTYEYATIPPIGVIYKSAVELVTASIPSASGAWAEVQDQIRLVGSYGKPTFSDPLIFKTVSAMGGWVDLCRSEEPVGVIRAQFLRIYEGLLESETERTENAALLERIAPTKPQIVQLKGGALSES
jgi:hypothetical protein